MAELGRVFFDTERARELFLIERPVMVSCELISSQWLECAWTAVARTDIPKRSGMESAAGIARQDLVFLGDVVQSPPLGIDPCSVPDGEKEPIASRGCASVRSPQRLPDSAQREHGMLFGCGWS